LQGRGVRPAVGRGDPDADVVRRRLGVTDRDIEEPILVQNARVTKLVLGLGPAAPGVLGNELPIGEGRLRVAIQPFTIGMRRRRTNRPPILLDVLAVISLRVGQAEQPLFEPVIVGVP
jgi:hypothetical protein